MKQFTNFEFEMSGLLASFFFDADEMSFTSFQRGKAVRTSFGQPTSKWETIITAIRARQYRRAITNLCNATAGTKRHFNEVVMRKVRSEVKTLLELPADTFSLNKSVDLQSIGDFSWEKTLNAAKKHAPVLYSSLVGSVTNVQNKETLTRGKNVNLKPRLGSALAILLHARAPQKCHILQTIFSIQMWRGRLKRETIKQFSHLGLCAGYERTLKAIDAIRENFDKAAVRLKENIEKSMKEQKQVAEVASEDLDLSFALSEGVPNIEDLTFDDTILYSDDNEKDSLSSCEEGESEVEDITDIEGTGERGGEEEEDEEEDEEEEDEEEVVVELDENEDIGEEFHEEEIEMEIQEADEFVSNQPTNIANDAPPGFTMCWDNVGKKVITRRPTENVKNKYINMALGYMALNRTSLKDIDKVQDDTTVLASEIPVTTFLPSTEDEQVLHNRMKIIVGRMIVRHFKWFQESFSNNITHHIVHEHSLRSTQKSLLINLGVFNEDPSSTQGAIGIYEALQRYIPTVDDKPVTAIVYGDGLSCERGNDARKARANGLNPCERLEGLEPGVQEFHKEMLLLQDFYDTFYKGSSASDRGTLCHLKNLFNFRQVKGDISDNFSHAWELMSTLVEGYVCLLLMELKDINDTSSRPADAPLQIEDQSHDVKQVYFDDVCSSIVEKVWQNLDTDTLKEHADDQDFVVCCGTEMDDDLIGCESRSNCIGGEYFHYSCVDIDPENVTYPWYCSDQCRNQPRQPYQYCNCKTDLGTDEPMIGCDGDPRCLKYDWYHMRCVGIDPEKPPKGKWYCSDQCRPKRKRSGSKSKTRVSPNVSRKDHKHLYSTACLWYGLNMLCRRDAVREADGNAMMSFWKYDLVHFFGNKHPKYTILAHRLIASTNGWLTERLKYDIIHNRTVNYSGGIGRNLPMDFMNEILNRLFKDLLESAKGRYTDLTIQRCSQIIGPLGEALDSIFDVNIVQQEVYRHRYRAVNRDENVLRLIQFLADENIFKIVPGRKHNAFPDYDININPGKPEAFAAKVIQLSKRLDKLKSVVLDE
ncbi:uncharacterized protein LOC132719356 [Ruditapes philippinarum]|uniref:uncharacterized protein LOC132719356 n=1 Tax=Ruditapes philippinarum TaxID=129788 RepID=UPI00295BC7B4|nr:uncharacterized protein LOC132719356 [Ruditapes philippinarum]